VGGACDAWERRENCARFWWESPRERDPSEGVTGSCEHGDELLGSGATEFISHKTN
jgi:hypothetical protein